MSVGLLVMLWSVWGSQTRLDEREGEPIKAGSIVGPFVITLAYNPNLG